MSRTARSFVLVALCTLLVAPTLSAKSFTPKKNTRAEVKAYVQRAAEVVRKHGAACATFQSKEWASGDYYIFVSGDDNKLICHANASLIGKDNNTIVDANGKNVGKALSDAAKKSAKGGWADYVWPRPGDTKSVAKSSYVMQVKGPDGKTYLVGAGGYELK